MYRLLSAVNDEPALRKDLEDNELVSTLHVDAPIGRKFRPFFTMITGRGSVAALAISDIGEFLSSIIHTSVLNNNICRIFGSFL